MPHVKVLAVGATMTAQGSDTLALSQYVREFSGMGQMSVPSLLSLVPEASRFATLEADQDWSELDPPMAPMDQWTSVARRLQHLFDSDDGLTGAVLVHGTNVLEETAYLLHLVLKTDRPVVIVGAQRPITGLSSDGPINLVNAVRVAVSEEAVGRGVMVVLNDAIHSARHVTKGNTYRLQTFHSPGWGPIGYVDPDRVSFAYYLDRLHTTETRFHVDTIGEWPRVDILYGYHGVDGSLVDAAVGLGARGLVDRGIRRRGRAGDERCASTRDFARRRGRARVANRQRARPCRRQREPVRVDRVRRSQRSESTLLLQLALTLTGNPQELQEIFDTH